MTKLTHLNNTLGKVLLKNNLDEGTIFLHSNKNDLVLYHIDPDTLVITEFPTGVGKSFSGKVNKDFKIKLYNLIKIYKKNIINKGPMYFAMTILENIG